MWAFVALRTTGTGETNTTPPLSTWARSGEQQHQDDRDEQPVEQEGQERQLKDVEAHIGTELWIVHIERLRVAEQQPRLPLRNSRQCDDDGHQQRRGVPDQPQTLAEHLVEALDVRVHVRRERRRRGAIGDEQVDERKHQERQEEPGEERQLGADDTPEHITAIERLMPEEVDVEPSDRPPEDEDEHEQSAQGDEDATATDPASWAIDRQVL